MSAEVLELDERLKRGRAEVPPGQVSAGEEGDRGGGGGRVDPPPPLDPDSSRGGGRPDRPPSWLRMLAWFAVIFGLIWLILDHLWPSRQERKA